MIGTISDRITSSWVTMVVPMSSRSCCVAVSKALPRVGSGPPCMWASMARVTLPLIGASTTEAPKMMTMNMPR